jgi:hypothetical protein
MNLRIHLRCLSGRVWHGTHPACHVAEHCDHSGTQQTTWHTYSVQLTTMPSAADGHCGHGPSVLWHTTAQSRRTCAPTDRWHGTNHDSWHGPNRDSWHGTNHDSWHGTNHDSWHGTNHDRWHAEPGQPRQGVDLPTHKRPNARARDRCYDVPLCVISSERLARACRRAYRFACSSAAKAGGRAGEYREKIGRALRAGGSSRPVVCALEKAEPHRCPVAFPPLHLPTLSTPAQPEHRNHRHTPSAKADHRRRAAPQL